MHDLLAPDALAPGLGTGMLVNAFACEIGTNFGRFIDGNCSTIRTLFRSVFALLGDDPLVRAFVPGPGFGLEEVRPVLELQDRVAGGPVISASETTNCRETENIAR